MSTFAFPRFARIAGLLALAGASVSVAMLPPRHTLGETTPGRSVVPTNQIVTPAGLVRRTEGTRPKDLALSPDGKTLAVLTQNSVILYTAGGDHLASVEIAPGPLGIAWAPDGTAVFASGDKGQVHRVVRQGDTWKAGEPIRLAELRESVADAGAAAYGRTNSPGGRTLVPLDAPMKDNPQVAGIAVSLDGKTLYAALAMRNAVAVVDLDSGRTRAAVPVGVCPYRIALSPDGRTLGVACRGGRFPVTGEPSSLSAGTPVRVDPKTDAPLAGTLVLISTGTLEKREVTVGRQPSCVMFTRDSRLAGVANADDDTLDAVDVASGRVIASMSVRPPDDPMFGQMPTDMAISDDGRTLYATCGGGNTVAVIDLVAERVQGYIPTGWFPVAIAQRNGTLFVASTKGIGARLANRNGAYNVHSTVGTVQFIAPKDRSDLPGLTRQVASNNRWGASELPPRPGVKPVPVPERVGEPSVFRHVVYIIKENHTYDQDLGDIPEGNGDARLVMFGKDVTPNLHKIAREFVLLDNTYTSGTNSADGHQWTSASMANAYVEQNYAAHARSYPYDGGDALAAPPKGYLWNAAKKAGISLRVYGEFVDKPSIKDPDTGRTPSWTECWKDYRSGANRIVIRSDTSTKALKPYLHPNYIGFPQIVSDQWRADTYIADLKRFEKAGRMPRLQILLLPNNHTSGTSPSMPTPRAMVADNDLATGRIIDAISHSKFWKETLILVIEDDSQFGVDHVDGHRTMAFCVSPYTKRGVVVSEMYNHTSVVRTMELVLGMPAMNRFDRTATPMTACFNTKPDYRPYTHLANRIALDEMNKPASALSGEARRLALASSRLDWSDLDRADPATVTRAVWSAQRPGVPFPTRYYRPPMDKEDEDE
jgi:DNA-binding beta-propeller fold protein YncE/phospholipase C